jgi:hypothetical protein
MTARVNMLFVALEKDIRIDDIEPLQKAIEQMKGVLEAKPNITTPADFVAECRIRKDFVKKVIDIIHLVAWGGEDDNNKK